MSRPGDEQEESWRTTVNLLGVIAVLLILGAGFWLMTELDRARKAQLCLASGQRHCRQIAAP